MQYTQVMQYLKDEVFSWQRSILHVVKKKKIQISTLSPEGSGGEKKKNSKIYKFSIFHSQV